MNDLDEQQQQKQIDLLQNLRIILLKIKQELKNDLTKLAIRNMPLMIEDLQTEHVTLEQTEPTQQVNLSQSTNEDNEMDRDSNHIIQELEPLDLDV